MITAKIIQKFEELKFFYGILDRNYRTQCLNFLSENGSSSVTEIQEGIKASQSATSQALKELREADLVKSSRAGKYRKYAINNSQVKSKIFGARIPTGETKAIVQTHSIMNFWFACHNMTKCNLIERVFSDFVDLSTLNHLSVKFEKSDKDLMQFFEHLDPKKRQILIEYIMKNYEGINLKTIKNEYVK